MILYQNVIGEKMNYEYLKTFYFVCKHESFSKAAKELYTSQPAISRIISLLENELNVKLFFRRKEGVRLTKEGEAFYKSIELPLNQLNRFENEMSKNEKILDEVIYIGATVTALSCFLFDLINTFSKKFPNIHYRIYTGSSLSILEMFNNGKIDIAFITTPFNKNNNLKIANVLVIDNVLVCGEKYKELAKDKVSIRELTNYPFILLSKDMQFRTHIDEFLDKNNVIINPEFEADSSSVIMPMVERNYGLAFIPYEMAKESIENVIKAVTKSAFEQIGKVYQMITDVLNYAHVDVHTLGNHDFDWGLDKIVSNKARKASDGWSMNNLSANIYDYDFEAKEESE